MADAFGGGHLSACPLWRADRADELHVFWECEKIHQCGLQEATASQDLCGEAKLRVVDYPCLWLRGLLPHGLLDVGTTPDSLPLFAVGHPPNHFADGGLCYTDGSGGEYGSTPSLFRCGIGVAHLTGSCTCDWGVYSGSSWCRADSPAGGTLCSITCYMHGQIKQ